MLCVCVCHIPAFYRLWRRHWNLFSGYFFMHNCDSGQACLSLGLRLLGQLWRGGQRSQVRVYLIGRSSVGSYVVVKLGLNSVKCNNIFINKIKPLRVSANDGLHR
jgi:hypothetical protein